MLKTKLKNNPKKPKKPKKQKYQTQWKQSLYAEMPRDKKLKHIFAITKA